MIRRGLSTEIKQTFINNNKIREPDDFFEQIIIYDFQNLPDSFHGLSESEIIREAYRVLKTNGLLLFQFHNIISPQGDFAVESLANSFKKSHFYNEISIEDVRKYFIQAINREPELIGFKELYVGYLKKL